MNDEKYFNNKLLEIIGIIVFMTIYSLLGIYAIPMNLIIFPVPFIYLGIRSGVLKSTLSQLIVAIVIAILANIISGAMLILLFLPVSYTIIDGIKNRRKSVEILGLSTAILFVSLLLFYSFTQNITQINIISQMEASFKQLLDLQVEMFKDMGLTNFEILKTTSELESSYKYVLWIFPVILFISSLFVCYINYYLSVIFLRKSGIGIVSIPRLSRFKLPNNIMLGVIVMLLGVYLMKAINLPHFETMFLNVIAFIWFMFLIQGLSVIDFYLIKLKFKIVLRIILLGLFSSLEPMGSLIFIIGISDVIFDYRKFRKRKA